MVTSRVFLDRRLTCWGGEEGKKQIESKHGNVVRQTHSGNTSILAAASDGLVPRYHRMCVSAHQNRLTVDTVYTMRVCSPEADTRWCWSLRGRLWPRTSTAGTCSTVDTGSEGMSTADVLSAVDWNRE